MKGFTLPGDLLLGSATAATQIEGGDEYVNWYAWSLQGKVGKGESSLTGADHWNRFREDIGLMAGMGHQCYRMSIEWSRIEPQRGRWSAEGIARYREELSLLREKNILPLVTLHHFSCPQWFQERGGWTSKGAVEDFLNFSRKAVESLGDLVSEWCTINEPNVFANDTYMDGKYPPGRRNDLRSYFRASRNLILAHLDCYEMIHRVRKERGFPGETRVGMVHHLAWFESSRPGIRPRLGKALVTRLFQTLYFEGMVKGRLMLPLGLGHPRGKGIFCDFIGVNYYSRHLISRFGDIFFDPALNEEETTDLGWEIFPEGLGNVVRVCWNRYKLPVYITENGLADESDGKRAAFIRDHLRQLKELRDEGIPVMRYYHWSLMDNLEWNDGYGPKFGLVEIDYSTMERKIRPSGRYYAQICKSHFVKEDTHADIEN